MSRRVSKTIVQGAAIAAALVLAPAAIAQTNQTVTSTSQNVTVGGVNFTAYNGNATGENTGGGSVAVTSTRPNAVAGDTGSLEIHGDRSRYVIGSLYGTLSSAGFSLSSLGSFTFDWNVDQTTGSQLHAAPVARVIVADNSGARAELIWEHVYNGGAAGVSPTLDTWANAGAGDVWYANLRAPNGNVFGTFAANSQAGTTGMGIIGPDGQGRGVLGLNGGQLNLTLSSWAQYFSADAKVVGISFGAGSGFGGGFTGFVDNAQITTRLGTDTINFEAAAGAVPEPATWAMLMIGFGAMGASLRVRRQRAKIAFA